jgi:uncharacterized protein YjbJ (UPF0337 family)
MNKETIQGNWEQVKGKAKQKWALLGDNDFSLYQKGKVQEFAGRIQEVYGKSKDNVEKEIQEFEENCGYSSSDKAA